MTNTELVFACDSIIDWILDQPFYPERAEHLDVINHIRAKIDTAEEEKTET